VQVQSKQGKEMGNEFSRDSIKYKFSAIPVARRHVLRWDEAAGRGNDKEPYRTCDFSSHTSSNEAGRNNFVWIHAFFMSKASFCIHHRCHLHRLTLQYAACATKPLGRM
jgi:hypothetical protein